MKIEIEEIESILLQKKIDKIKVQEIIRDLEKVAEELKEEK
jgi:GTP-binding protein EngB required for normal cell division